MAHIALLGNPNVGKSLLFNKLTGSNQKVGNFPGITLSYLDGVYVSKTSGEKITHRITDLPGIYGFVSNNREDHVVHSFLVENTPDLIINVIDSTRLERNLSLTLQLLELNIPTILVLTFKDKLEKKGVSLTSDSLTNEFGIPVFSLNTHDNIEISQFQELLDNALRYSTHPNYNREYSKYTSLIESIEEKLPIPIVLDNSNFLSKFPKRWLVLSNLLTTKSQSELWPQWFKDQFQELIVRRLEIVRILENLNILS